MPMALGRMEEKRYLHHFVHKKSVTTASRVFMQVSYHNRVFGGNKLAQPLDSVLL